MEKTGICIRKKTYENVVNVDMLLYNENLNFIKEEYR